MGRRARPLGRSCVRVVHVRCRQDVFRSGRRHLRSKVVVQRGSVLCERDDPLGESLDVDEVHRGDILAHGRLRRPDDLLRHVLVAGDLGEGLERVVVERGLVLDCERELRVEVVVVDDLDELGEVPAVPLAHAHDERVDVLIQDIDERDGVDDHVVRAVHVELHAGSGERVRQTQLGLLVVAILQPLEESGEVRAAAAHDLADLVVALARNARLVDDGVPQLGIGHAQAELGLLGVFHLWEVQLEEIFEFVGARGLGDVVDLVEGHRRGGEGLETLELNHLAEAGHVGYGSLDSLGGLANLIQVEALEEGVAGG
mmetsp:Transcript_3666/g.16071  ORF Transcript_3666/g.16071 Transcript_3666/m.16071 type:complete len:314 (-) Transcript_3666:135-1076(-)